MHRSTEVEPTINIRILPLSKNTQKKFRCSRKLCFHLFKHVLNPSYRRCPPHRRILFKYIERWFYILQYQTCQLKCTWEKCARNWENKLTIPFMPPHLIRSRTRSLTLQRAEKLTTAHLSILLALISLWETEFQMLCVDTIEVCIQTKRK